MGQQKTYATVDCRGAPVIAGTRVRIFVLAEAVLARLEPHEFERVQSMIGETFEVYEVDEQGGAWVEKWWRETDRKSESHSIGLQPNEMEVVTNDV